MDSNAEHMELDDTDFVLKSHTSSTNKQFLLSPSCAEDETTQSPGDSSAVVISNNGDIVQSEVARHEILFGAGAYVAAHESPPSPCTDPLQTAVGVIDNVDCEDSSEQEIPGVINYTEDGELVCDPAKLSDSAYRAYCLNRILGGCGGGGTALSGVVSQQQQQQNSAHMALCAPSRFNLPVSRDGYMCDQCGERFILPSGLSQHQARRVTKLLYECSVCREIRVFYNKCQFLEHLASHDIALEKLDPSSVEIGILEDNEIVDPIRLITLSAISARSISGPPTLKQMSRLHSIDKPVHVSCAICNILCTSKSMHDHMCPPASSETLDSIPPRCPECAQPCPTECSLLAHQGLHKPALWPYPYICPECGVKLLGTIDDFRQHVVCECLHLTRDLKSCCSVCYMETGDTVLHMIQTHVQRLYKCRYCPLAFESVDGFHSHVNAKHDGQLASMMAMGSGTESTPYLAILKCPFCLATFNSSRTLKEHMMSKRHGPRVLELVRFVFRCPECELEYSRKQLLADHIVRQHPGFSFAAAEHQDQAGEGTSVMVEMLVDGAGGADTTRGVHAQSVTLEPLQPARERTQLSNHSSSSVTAPAASTASASTRPAPEKKTPGRRGRPPKYLSQSVTHGAVSTYNFTCCLCAHTFRRRTELMAHIRAHVDHQDTSALCQLCNALVGSTGEHLRAHLHKCHAHEERCSLCHSRLLAGEQMQRHLEAEHRLRQFECALCEAEFASLAALTRHNYSMHACSTYSGAPAVGVVCQTASSCHRGTLPGVTSLYDVGGDTGQAPTQYVARRGRPRGGNTAAATLLASKSSGAATHVTNTGAIYNSTADPLGAVNSVTLAVTNQQQQLSFQGAQTLSHMQPLAATTPTSVHILHEMSVACAHCGLLYSTEASLNKHIMLAHKQQQPPEVVVEAATHMQTRSQTAAATPQAVITTMETINTPISADSCHDNVVQTISADNCHDNVMHSITQSFSSSADSPAAVHSSALTTAASNIHQQTVDVSANITCAANTSLPITSGATSGHPASDSQQVAGVCIFVEGQCHVCAQVFEVEADLHEHLRAKHGLDEVQRYMENTARCRHYVQQMSSGDSLVLAAPQASLQLDACCAHEDAVGLSSAATAAETIEQISQFVSASMGASVADASTEHGLGSAAAEVVVSDDEVMEVTQPTLHQMQTLSVRHDQPNNQIVEVASLDGQTVVKMELELEMCDKSGVVKEKSSSVLEVVNDTTLASSSININ